MSWRVCVDFSTSNPHPVPALPPRLGPERKESHQSWGSLGGKEWIE